MELVLFITAILNLISVGLNIYSYARYKELISEIIKDQSYPEYYKDVLIYYYLPGESEEHVEKAWLAVNDDLEYIWTKSDTDEIIPDEYVIRWKHIK